MRQTRLLGFAFVKRKLKKTARYAGCDFNSNKFENGP
jgi:hypothetical protein